MKIYNKITGTFVILAGLPFSMVACDYLNPVSYSEDVKPILEKACLECHKPGAEGFVASGFNMQSYDDLMKGTSNGPMIIAGDVESSNLVVLIEGRADPSISMPHSHGQKKSLSKEDTQTIRSWIEQGAKNN